MSNKRDKDDPRAMGSKEVLSKGVAWTRFEYKNTKAVLVLSP